MNKPLEIENKYLTDSNIKEILSLHNDNNHRKQIQIMNRFLLFVDLYIEMRNESKDNFDTNVVPLIAFVSVVEILCPIWINKFCTTKNINYNFLKEELSRLIDIDQIKESKNKSSSEDLSIKNENNENNKNNKNKLQQNELIQKLQKEEETKIIELKNTLLKNKHFTKPSLKKDLFIIMAFFLHVSYDENTIKIIKDKSFIESIAFIKNKNNIKLNKIKKNKLEIMHENKNIYDFNEVQVLKKFFFNIISIFEINNNDFYIKFHEKLKTFTADNHIQLDYPNTLKYHIQFLKREEFSQCFKNSIFNVALETEDQINKELEILKTILSSTQEKSKTILPSVINEILANDIFSKEWSLIVQDLRLKYFRSLNEIENPKIEKIIILDNEDLDSIRDINQFPQFLSNNSINIKTIKIEVSDKIKKAIKPNIFEGASADYIKNMINYIGSNTTRDNFQYLYTYADKHEDIMEIKNIILQKENYVISYELYENFNDFFINSNNKIRQFIGSNPFDNEEFILTLYRIINKDKNYPKDWNEYPIWLKSIILNKIKITLKQQEEFFTLVYQRKDKIIIDYIINTSYVDKYNEFVAKMQKQVTNSN